MCRGDINRQIMLSHCTSNNHDQLRLFYKIYPGDFEAKERAQNLSFTEVAVNLKLYVQGASIKNIFS